MFLAFLKSPFYDRIACMTQYSYDSYDSDLSNTSSSDEENQYDMVRINDDVHIQYKDRSKTENNILLRKPYNYNLREADDYYFVSYENTDTLFERYCKDCLNYTAVIVCIGVHIILIYIILTLY